MIFIFLNALLVFFICKLHNSAKPTLVARHVFHEKKKCFTSSPNKNGISLQLLHEHILFLVNLFSLYRSLLSISEKATYLFQGLSD